MIEKREKIGVFVRPANRKKLIAMAASEEMPLSVLINGIIIKYLRECNEK